MKVLVTFLFCSCILVAKAEEQIQIVRYGTNVTERPSPAFVTNIVELVRSCKYHDPDPVSAEAWPDHSDSLVCVTFAAPTNVKAKIVDVEVGASGKFEIKESKEVIMDQILVPLPDGGAGPASIFVRSGTNIIRFAKWDPKRLGMVGSEPALQMRSGLYKALANIKRSDK